MTAVEKVTGQTIPERSDRVARRKARTRGALVAAAQSLLAQGRTHVSIQEITDTADVGFGSFYNHFASKEELFGEAVHASLESYAALLTVARAGIDDPAEAFAVSFRLTGRLRPQVPEQVRILLNSGTSVLVRDESLAVMARADMAAAIATGRFDGEDPDLALMLVGGALLGMLQMLESRPDVDDAQVSDEFAERLLRGLGLPADEAREVCARPLPQMPSLGG